MPARGLCLRDENAKLCGGIPQENELAVVLACRRLDIRMDALRPECRRRDRTGYERLSAALSFASPAGADLDFAGFCDLEIGLPAL